MKDDTISRQAAIDALQKEINKGIPPFDDVMGSIRCGVRLARNIIEDLPSADRPRGEWLPIIEANEFGETYQAGIYCSECGETLGCEANFCPNCGASMTEREDE